MSHYCNGRRIQYIMDDYHKEAQIADTTCANRRTVL